MAAARHKGSKECVASKRWRVLGKSFAVLACCLSVAGSLVFGASSSAGAAASKAAIITGTVVECGPGPIVLAPPAPQPLPKPASVILMHGSHTYAREAITFPKSLPWSGSFSFNVPAAHYEVL